MTAEPRIFGNSAVIALNDETVGLVGAAELSASSASGVTVVALASAETAVGVAGADDGLALSFAVHPEINIATMERVIRFRMRNSCS